MAAGKNRNELLFKSASLSNRSFLQFESMREKREFCDVSFRIGDQTISAHRVVLAAGIPYFHGFLSRQGTNFECTEFDMPDIDSNTWKSLIDYAYNGEVKINLENVKQLLSAACALMVEEVKCACCKFWAEHVCLDNAVNIRDFSLSHDCTELVEKAEYFIHENFETVSHTEDFLGMSSSNLSLLISADDLKVTSEEKVFEAVMRWVKQNPESRKQYLPKILRKVRLPLLKPDYLRSIVLDEELIHESIVCRDLITKARDYHALPETEKEVCGFSDKSRVFNKNKSSKDKEDAICVICTELSLTANHFNPLTEEWYMKERHLYPIDSCTLVPMNRELYFFCGTNVLTCTSPDYEWKSCCRRYSRHFAASATLGDEIYICGGVNGDSPCNIVECFDTKSEEWTIPKRMNVSRIFASATSLQGHVYVMGGMDGCSVLNSVELYNPLIKTWTEMSPMLTKRWGFSSTALNEKIYVCGGLVSGDEEKCVSTAEVYSPTTNQWAFVSSMNIPRWYLSMFPYGGKLYAVGGKDDQSKYVNTLEIYDPDANEWKLSPPARLQLGTSATAVVISPPVS